MPISESEKKVLLERLEKARIAKQAKAAEAKKAKEVKAAPAPAPEPTPAPAPAPAPVPVPAPAPAPAPEPAPVSEPIDIPAPKKSAKKACLIPSDSEDEEEVPKKKAKAVAKKEPKYLKIVLYKEPANPVAFQQLLEAVNDNGGEYEDEEAVPEPPAPREYHKGPRVVQKVGAGPRNTPARSLSKEDIETAELRRLSMLIFG